MLKLPDRRALALIAATLVGLFAPFSIVLVTFVRDTNRPYSLQLFLADIPLAIVTALSVPGLVSAIRQRTLGPDSAPCCRHRRSEVMSLAIHPSSVGAQTEVAPL